MLLLVILLISVILGNINKNPVKLKLEKIWLCIVGAMIIVAGGVLIYFNTDVLIVTRLIGNIFIIIFVFKNIKEISTFMIGLGYTLNSIVMISNNGKMPVKLLGIISEEVIDARHSVLIDDTSFYWLADIIKLPYPLSIGNYILSIGDVVSFIGLGIFMYKIFSEKLDYKFKLY